MHRKVVEKLSSYVDYLVHAVSNNLGLCAHDGTSLEDGCYDAHNYNWDGKAQAIKEEYDNGDTTSKSI